MRRTVIAALAGAGLLVPTALVVGRINDNDSHPIVPIIGLVSAPTAAADVCGGGLAWACVVTPQIDAASTGLVSAQAPAAPVCGGEFGWVCVFTPPIEAAPTGTATAAATAADVCSGGLAWACIFTPQLVGQN
jgi:hypothetical protein